MFRRGAALCVLVVLISLLPPGASAQDRSPPPTQRGCTGTTVTPRLSTRVLRKSRPNQTLCFTSGVYRHGITAKEEQMLVASPRTVLRGRGKGIGIRVKRGGSAKGFEVKRFGIGIKTVHNTTVANNQVHHNKKVGINAYGRGIVIRGNEIAHNFFTGDESKPKACWGKGGAYMANTRRLLFTRNRVHHNVCDGVHFDVGSRRGKVVHNRTMRNTRFGIFFEASCDGKIKRNTSRRNRGGGVGISTSLRVHVHHNRFGDNGKRIGVLIWDHKGHQGVKPKCNPKYRSGGHRVYKNRMHGDRVIRRK